MNFVKYVLHRFALMILTLLIIASATFFLVNAVPGNPIAAKTMLMSEAARNELYAKYGFDKPLFTRYVITMSGLLRGDFGVSVAHEGDTVQSIIASKLPVSAQLGFQQMLLGVTLGLVLGIIAAKKNRKAADFLITVFVALAVSIPQLVLALLLQKFFAGAKTGLPIIGWSGFSSTILPTLAGAFVYTSFYARLMKSSFLDVMGQEYILTAESKGLSDLRIIMRHILRNAFVPILTYLPMTVAMCITGSFFVESVFTIPGLGYYYVRAVQLRDLSVVMGLTVFFAALVLIVVFATDLLYKLVDPRIRLECTGKR
jgi:oligopeptide transport system permease protein